MHHDQMRFMDARPGINIQRLFHILCLINKLKKIFYDYISQKVLNKINVHS